MSQWLVIGISGITCGGKTTLAQKIHQFFLSHRDEQIANSNYIIGDTVLFMQDNYFLPVQDERHQIIPQLNHINWEILTALDMDRLLFDVGNILKDNYLLHDIRLNLNNSTNNMTTTNTVVSTTGPTAARKSPGATTFQKQLNILIVEGNLIFNQPQLLQIFQLKFHIHLPIEKCFERRKIRIYDPADVIGYFEMCVWPLYEKHFQEFKDRKDIIILNGEISQEKIFKFVMNCIHDIL